ncbi:MAG: hypothetical protein ACK4YP_06835 [Myxococcota bacterium]
MIIEELEITWRSGARTHRLVLDVDGIPTLDGVSADTRRLAPREARLEPPPEAHPGTERRGKAWTEEEETRLREGFAAGEDPAALGRAIGRTRGAVAARLVRLGLLTEEAAGLRYPVQRPDAAAPAEPEGTPGG